MLEGDNENSENFTPVNNTQYTVYYCIPSLFNSCFSKEDLVHVPLPRLSIGQCKIRYAYVYILIYYIDCVDLIYEYVWSSFDSFTFHSIKF